MQDFYTLKSEYSALSRALEALLHDAAMIEMLEHLFGDALGHKTNVAMMTDYNDRIIQYLVDHIPLPIDKLELHESIHAAVNTVYQARLEPARCFGKWMAESLSPKTHVFYVQRTQEEFVKMRILLDKHMRHIFGKFFDRAMREEECISVPTLFKIDLLRQSQSYADAVRAGYRPRKV